MEVGKPGLLLILYTTEAHAGQSLAVLHGIGTPWNGVPIGCTIGTCAPINTP
jgi:hypothetical protein